MESFKVLYLKNEKGLLIASNDPMYDYDTMLNDVTVEFSEYIYIHGYYHSKTYHDNAKNFGFFIDECYYGKYCIKDSDFYYKKKYFNLFGEKIKILKDGYYKKKTFDEKLFVINSGCIKIVK